MSAPQFKKKKRRGHLKKREQVSLEDITKADDDVQEKIEATLEEQRLRSRELGINAEKLAKPEEEVDEEEEELQQYGLQPKKSKTSKNAEEDGMKGITTAFAEETGRMDRDKEMMKYIKEKLREEEGKQPSQRNMSKYDELMSSLYTLPEHLQDKKEEEEVDRGMLSNTILQGIPEVSLGIDEKIKNIEKTEQAKAQQDRKRMEKMANKLGLRKVDTGLNYASARYDLFRSRRRHEDDTTAAYESAKRAAFEEGKTESVSLKLERESEAQRRRKKREDDGLSADDRAFNAYRRRFKRY